MLWKAILVAPCRLDISLPFLGVSLQAVSILAHYLTLSGRKTGCTHKINMKISHCHFKLHLVIPTVRQLARYPRFTVLLP